MNRNVLERRIDLRDRVFGDAPASAHGKSRQSQIAYLSRRYGISKREAARCFDGRRDDSETLEDWNDSRSILGM